MSGEKPAGSDTQEAMNAGLYAGYVMACGILRAVVERTEEIGREFEDIEGLATPMEKALCADRIATLKSALAVMDESANSVRAHHGISESDAAGIRDGIAPALADVRKGITFGSIVNAARKAKR